MHLRSKPDIRNMSERMKFRLENDSKSGKDLHFFIFFLKRPLPLKKPLKVEVKPFKKPYLLKKNEKCYSIFYYRNRNTY